jgi:hypothetical protein
MVAFNVGPLPRLLLVCGMLIMIFLQIGEVFGFGRHIAVPVALFFAVQLQKYELL